MSDSLLLDTHILLWILLEPNKIPEAVKLQIESAQADNKLMISSISLWEIAVLKYKKRINIYEPIKDFLESIVKIEGMSVVEISAEIAAESIMLLDNFHNDPADRIIVASARCTGAVLVTKDQKILDWAKLGHLKVLGV